MGDLSPVIEGHVKHRDGKKVTFSSLKLVSATVCTTAAQAPLPVVVFYLTSVWQHYVNQNIYCLNFISVEASLRPGHPPVPCCR